MIIVLIKSLFLHSDSCFKGGTDYNGFDITGGEKLSALDCQKWCDDTSSCVAFTYVIEWKKCHLKNTIPPPASAPGHISGFECETGNIVCQVML